jgi:hypothetical protein
MICQIRDHNECACPIDRCYAQPPKAQEAPIRFSVRDQLYAIAFGIAMTGFAYLALSEADRQFKAQDLRNQEVNAYVYRR